MLNIKDIQVIALGEGDVLWVTVPRGSLPTHIYQKHTDEVRRNLEMLFLSTRILITPEGYDFKAISADYFLKAQQQDE